MDVKIELKPDIINAGEQVTLEATFPSVTPLKRYEYRWEVSGGNVSPLNGQGTDVPPILTARWTPDPNAHKHNVTFHFKEVLEDGTELQHQESASLQVKPLPPPKPSPIREAVRETLQELSAAGTDGRLPAFPVALRRTSHPLSREMILWMIIRRTTDQLSFKEYSRFIDEHLCRNTQVTGSFPASGPGGTPYLHKAHPQRALPVDAYRKLKAMTEAFFLIRTGVLVDFATLDPAEESARIGTAIPPDVDFEEVWKRYLEKVNGSSADNGALPYLAIIRRKLSEEPLLRGDASDRQIDCYGILEQKLALPTFVEFIHEYWLEEGMLVQTMNHISLRFQNVRRPGLRDPLANLEVDPLRPLGNLLWGYIQDENQRLSVKRRAYEYDHHYGFTLHGRAVAGMRSAERRSKFLESFHHLLHQCVQFFRQDDDTTVVADGFPVLNAIKETHYLLAQGAHNQFGDLPSTARQEMLIQQWLLSRPEMREFLGGRVMVPYPETWMDRVDAMKALQEWTDVSVVHFHELATFGEQLLLTVRYGAWSMSNDPAQAANWARYWRPEIQGYIHAYRAVTGVDLTADITDQQRLAERYVAPSVHLRHRLALQRRR
jgi:hypothetical protein